MLNNMITTSLTKEFLLVSEKGMLKLFGHAHRMDGRKIKYVYDSNVNVADTRIDNYRDLAKISNIKWKLDTNLSKQHACIKGLMKISNKFSETYMLRMYQAEIFIATSLINIHLHLSSECLYFSNWNPNSVDGIATIFFYSSGNIHILLSYILTIKPGFI